MLYIAGPYSNPDPKRVAINAITHKAAASMLMLSNYVCFSPIVYGEQFLNIQGGSAMDWKNFNYRMVESCSGLVLLEEMEGWKESKGVQMELSWALGMQKRIVTIKPDGAMVKIKDVSGPFLDEIKRVAAQAEG
jgi:hypothetical protein